MLFNFFNLFNWLFNLDYHLPLFSSCLSRLGIPPFFSRNFLVFSPFLDQFILDLWFLVLVHELNLLLILLAADSVVSFQVIFKIDLKWEWDTFVKLDPLESIVVQCEAV